MEYPKNIYLTKISSLADYIFDEFQKYPIGFEVTGYMWEHTLPEEGSAFYVYNDKKTAYFRTSVVTELLEEGSEHILFKTLNSIYKISWKN